MSGGDPGLERVARGCEADRLALDANLAAVGTVDAAERLDQGRLAGAVVPEQAVDLTGMDGHRDAAQGLHVAEGLGNVVQLDQRGCGVLGHQRAPIARLRTTWLMMTAIRTMPPRKTWNQSASTRA